MADISSVLEKSKDYEFLVSTFDPMFQDVVDATNIFKKFIIDHKLILYGGTAIDFCLRLKGSQIYNDNLLAIPDLDVFSPNSVEHAYQLADLIFKAGYPNARAICAEFMKTMKVDLGGNHWIADISYMPQDVFNTLPWIEYNGMRCIHPDFQRIDQHSALSFAYDNPPREVIFSRWKKDIVRFNILNEHYPIAAPAVNDTMPTKSISVQGAKKYILTSMAAYACLYTVLNAVVQLPKDIIAAKFAVSDGTITFDGFGACELVHFNIEKCAKELNLTDVKHYEPYINMIPERIEGNQFTIFSTKNRLVSINSVKTDDTTVRITNIQFLLKQFLSAYFLHKTSKPKLAATYLLRYTSLLRMIECVEDHMVKNNISTPDGILALVFPSVQTYGTENINIAREVGLARLYHELKDAPAMIIPYNYYPAKSLAAGRPHPTFNYDDVHFFHESGKSLDADTS